MLTEPFLPGQDEEEDGDDKVGKHHVDPDIQGERGHEGEQLWVFFFWFSVENADSKGHERVGEVNSLFSLIGDG